MTATTAQIRTLLNIATSAGDAQMAEIYELALKGDERSIQTASRRWAAFEDGLSKIEGRLDEHEIRVGPIVFGKAAASNVRKTGDYHITITSGVGHLGDVVSIPEGWDGTLDGLGAVEEWASPMLQESIRMVEAGRDALVARIVHALRAPFAQLPAGAFVREPAELVEKRKRVEWQGDRAELEHTVRQVTGYWE